MYSDITTTAAFRKARAMLSRGPMSARDLAAILITIQSLRERQSLLDGCITRLRRELRTLQKQLSGIKGHRKVIDRLGHLR